VVAAHFAGGESTAINHHLKMAGLNEALLHFSSTNPFLAHVLD